MTGRTGADMRKATQAPLSNAGKELAFLLWVQADLIQGYSDDPDNPNVSAWLRSGAIEMILDVEDELAALYY